MSIHLPDHKRLLLAALAALLVVVLMACQLLAPPPPPPPPGGGAPPGEVHPPGEPPPGAPPPGEPPPGEMPPGEPPSGEMPPGEMPPPEAPAGAASPPASGGAVTATPSGCPPDSDCTFTVDLVLKDLTGMNPAHPGVVLTLENRSSYDLKNTAIVVTCRADGTAWSGSGNDHREATQTFTMSLGAGKEDTQQFFLPLEVEQFQYQVTCEAHLDGMLLDPDLSNNQRNTVVPDKAPPTGP